MKRSPVQRQRGITLIICMIVLLVLTVMGLSSIRDTSLEEKMAGNLKNHNIAFQAAESALRDGEQYIRENPQAVYDDSVRGVYKQMESVLGSMSASWGTSSARLEYADPTLNAHLASEPLYIIEQMTDGVPASSDSLEASQVLDHPFFRVTARSVGSTETAIVILQTVYKQ